MSTVTETKRSFEGKFRSSRPIESSAIGEAVGGDRCAQFHNSLLAVLGEAGAREIIRYKTKVGRGKVYWVYYRTQGDKKRATFLSPKEFQGYKWNSNYSEVVNLETGAKYQVSDDQCTCKYWFYAVRTGKEKACKHQNMRSEFGQSLAKAKQLSPYGVCHQCGSNYDIPGADDANHCPKCGWVELPLSKISPKQQGLVAATAPEALEDFFLAS